MEKTHTIQILILDGIAIILSLWPIWLSIDVWLIARYFIHNQYVTTAIVAIAFLFLFIMKECIEDIAFSDAIHELDEKNKDEIPWYK